MLRTSNVPASLDRWEQLLSVQRRFLSRIFTTVFYGFFLAHCMGMLWLSLALTSEPSPFLPTPEQQALPASSRYLQGLYWGTWCDATGEKGGEGTELRLTLWMCHRCALLHPGFGASCGTINPGEPNPGVQTAFSLVVSSVGVLFVAYTIGSVHRIVGRMQTSANALRAKLMVVEQFMKHHNLPRELHDKVTQYYTVRGGSVLLGFFFVPPSRCSTRGSITCVDGSWVSQFLYEVSGGRGQEEEALLDLPRCVRFELSYSVMSETVRQVCPAAGLRLHVPRVNYASTCRHGTA